MDDKKCGGCPCHRSIQDEVFCPIGEGPFLIGIDEQVVRVEFRLLVFQQRNDLVVLVSQKFLVALMPVEIGQRAKPGGGIAGQAVHVLGGKFGRRPTALGSIANQSDRMLHQKLVAEDRVDGFSSHLHIPDPETAIPLGCIPDFLLHAEMGRVGSGVPDTGQKGVRTIESSLILYRIIFVIADHAGQFDRG